MPPSKIPNVKTFYDPGNLKNKVKVKLITCNKRSCLNANCSKLDFPIYVTKCKPWLWILTFWCPVPVTLGGTIPFIAL